MVTYQLIWVELTRCRVDLSRGLVMDRELGEPRSLSTREADLLRYLADRPARLVTRDELLAEVWGYSDAVVSRACDTAVSRLRAKIGDDPVTPTHLVTVHGAGYRFEPLGPVGAPPDPAPVATPTTADRDDPPIVLGPVTVDLRRQRVRRPDGEVALTGQEGQLLDRLARANGGWVDRQTLERQIWGRIGGRGLTSAVRRLRRKVEPDPEEPRFLLSGRSGYRLERPVAGRLPDSRSALVGRTAEIELLGAALAESRWVVVFGPGGVGKTRLAREGTARAAGSPVWVDLVGAQTGDDLLGAVAGALGLAADVSPDHLIDVMTRRGPLLVVLDNLEGVDGRALGDAVSRWLAGAPELRLLGTTRVRPGLDGERALELEGLRREEAVQLFTERVRAASSSAAFRPAELEVLEALVERLDRLPLAIELAAARVPTLGPVELLARLERQLDLLAHPAGEVERHRSLRACLAQSFDALGVGDRQALLLLALFDHGFDADDAESLLGIDGIDQLQVLRDHSLVHTRVGEDRPFRVYEAIRRFAAECRAAEPDRGRDTELTWARWLARLGEPSHLARLFRRDEERTTHVHFERVGDLERATELALRWDDPDLALLLALGAAAVRELQGPHDPAIAALGRILDRPALESELEVRGRTARSRLLRLANHPVRALEEAERAIAVASTLGDPMLRIHAVRARGWALGDLVRPAETVRDLTEVAAALREVRPELAALEEARAAQYQLQVTPGDASASFQAWERAEAQAIRCRDEPCLLRALGVLARYDLYNGRVASAIRRLDEGVGLAQALRVPVQEEALSGVLMVALRVAGLHDRVEEVGERVLELSDRIGNWVNELLGASLLLASRVLRGDREEAWQAARLGRVAWSRHGGGVPRSIAYLEIWESLAWFADGTWDLAEATAASAAERMRVLGDDANLNRAESVRSLSLAKLGRVEEARAAAFLLVERERHRYSFDGPVGLARMGRVLAMTGDRPGAEAFASEAAHSAHYFGYEAEGGDAAVELAALRELLGQ